MTEEQKLSNYRRIAIESIRSYLDISGFSDEGKAAVNAVVASYTYYINNTNDYSEIDEYVEQAKDKLNEIYDSQESSEDSSEVQSSEEPSESSEPQSSEESPDESSAEESSELSETTSQEEET